MSTVHARVAAARQRLRESGIPPDEADIDARLLAQLVLDWDTARYFVSAGEPAPPLFTARYEQLVARRAAREPLAYITGTREFWNVAFEVSPAVLVPRPETELLVECALEQLPDASRLVADVCTGSGCVAVAIARERPGVRVVATDISPAALALARRNAERLGVADRIEVVAADLLEGLTARFDLIVSNPPYVPEGERPWLQPEVREYEPPLALFSGADGLTAIARLAAASIDRLVPGGFLMFEFGAGQEAAVRHLLESTTGLAIVDVRRDLQGLPRVAIARRR